MKAKTAAGTLREIARLLEVAGENPYRVRAFEGAARAVDSLGGELENLVTSGEILGVRGIGKGTAAVLSEMAEGRRPRALADAEEAVPEGVRGMLKLAGLGPKKVRTLWRDLGVETLGELEYACRENRLLDLKGFGPATQAAVLEALAFHARSRDRWLIHQAREGAAAVGGLLSKHPGVVEMEWAGELRRWCETVAELECVVTVDESASVEEIARSLGPADEAGGDQWLVRLEDGPDLRLWFTGRTAAGATLVRATGSGVFLDALAARGAEIPDRGSEAEVFEAMGTGWVPPELREDDAWVDRAAAGELPVLVRDDDVLGALHNHTTDSDGAASLEQMATAAAERGWTFFGVADHSPAAFYANGVDAERLEAQWARADEWNRTHPTLRILKGIEADIMPGGSLDIPSGCESGLDYVVASVHSSFRLDEKTQTDRVVAAVSHPACRVLGHPTGRLLLARPGYRIDLERVLDACAEHGVAVEINASPYRLDLDRRWARRALDRGLKLTVNPDAHSIEGLDDVRWGLAVARRAGATRDDLLNCLDIEEYLRR